MAPPLPTRRLLLHGALVVAHVAMLETAALTTGLTWDEPRYTGDGVAAFTIRRIPGNPVPTVSFGLAQYAAGTVSPTNGGWLGDHITPELRNARLHAARQATVAATTLGGLLLAAACGPASLLAHALWVASPTLLANGSLATLDAWTAAMSAGVALGCSRISAGRADGPWIAGIFAALTGSSKIVGFGALMLPLLLLWRSPGQLLRLVASTAILTWAVHGFLIDTIEFPIVGDLDVPAPKLFAQLSFQVDHIYVRGHPLTSPVGDPLYGLRALWWKLCPTTLALAALRLRSVRTNAAWLAWLAWPVTLFVLLSFAKTQLGIRYLLPATPFAIAWLARSDLPSWLLWAVGATLSIPSAPWLTWCNPLAGDRRAGVAAVVQATDWCQERELAIDWLADHPGGPVWYSGCDEAASIGLRMTPMPCTPTPGTYIVHAVDYDDRGSTLPQCLSWLDAEPLLLGDTLRIWVVD